MAYAKYGCCLFRIINNQKKGNPMTAPERLASKKEHEKFERDLNYHYQQFGRQFKDKEQALNMLLAKGYAQVGKSNIWRTKDKKTAWLNPLRNSEAEEITKFDEKKCQLVHVGVRVLGYFRIGWLVTFENSFNPASRGNLKLVKVPETSY